MNSIKLKFLIIIFLFPFALGGESENLLYGKKALAKRDYKSAIDYFVKEIRLYPKECYGYYYLGLTYEKLKEKEKSIEQFQNAIKVYCQKDLKEQSFWKIVNYYKFIEDWEKLYIYSKAFLKFKPSKEVEKYVLLAEKHYDPEKLRLQDLLYEAKQLEEEQNYQQAAEKYLEMFSIKKNVLFLIKAGNLYKEAGNKEKASEIFLKVLELEPENWYANFQMALMYYNKGKLLEAQEHIEKSYNNIEKTDKRNLYYLEILRAYIYLNLEKFDVVDKILFKIDELFSKENVNNFQKEKNYYIVFLLSKALQNQINEEYKRYLIYLENEYPEKYLYSMLDFFYQKKYDELYEYFIENINYQNTKIIPYSNFFNQFYIILLLIYDKELSKIEKLLAYRQESQFWEIISNSYGDFLLKQYLSNEKFLNTSDLLEYEFHNILKEVPYKDYLSLLLIYNTYKVKDYSFLKILFEKFYQNYHSLTNENLKAFLNYMNAIELLSKNQYESAFDYLKNAIDLNTNYRTIAKEEPLIQSLIQENEEWKNLIENKTFLDFLTN
ncbi:MAG: hypothetical protein KatS3mg129_2895 [Leptospiraceae bacterium]|nr:MAG: hypothetical protein KatS3mg129_2895 [Leptospiraceae bacterium]